MERGLLSDRELAADYAGNRQLISVGNLAGNDRVALILMDYAQRVRLKVLGRLAVQDLASRDALTQTLVDPTYQSLWTPQAVIHRVIPRLCMEVRGKSSSSGVFVGADLHGCRDRTMSTGSGLREVRAHCMWISCG